MAYNILCVDDIENNLFVLSNILEKNPDYTIFTALSAQDGFEILLKNSIDLILLDVMMPQMDGFEMASFLKQNPMTQDIPIIFVTAKTDEDSIKEAFVKGGVDYIAKPYRSYELIERVKLHLQVRDSKKKLDAKQKLLESIIEQQQNMIITTDGKTILSANRAFLNFCHVKNIRELKRNLKDIFLKMDGFFRIDEADYSNKWINDICTDNESDYIVAMIDSKDLESHAFLLKATKMVDEERYILTFTDVTKISMESKAFEKKAFHDNLTGIYNREKLNEFLDYEINMSKRYNSPLSVILFDIDDFKSVNDTYGHLVGDEVLKEIVQVTKSVIRKTDIFARWGGEEFVIVSTSTALNSASILAKHIREEIQNHTFNEVGRVTCSFGVSSYANNDTIEKMFARVDEAMYEAKKSGKNRVVVR